MLKQPKSLANARSKPAAAFGRLCVETGAGTLKREPADAAAFGRLCVETICLMVIIGQKFAAAFGRLCVETRTGAGGKTDCRAAAFGRLCVETCGCAAAGGIGNAAAFGRLCVETTDICFCFSIRWQPPSGGCVLKHRRYGHVLP